MRPRTATIQVAHSETQDLWIVQIGDVGTSTPTVNETGKNLAKLLKYAIIIWMYEEGLDD